MWTWGEILGRCSHKSRTPDPALEAEERPSPGFLTLPFRTGREVDSVVLRPSVWGTLLWQLQETYTTSASQ